MRVGRRGGRVAGFAGRDWAQQDEGSAAGRGEGCWGRGGGAGGAAVVGGVHLVQG